MAEARARRSSHFKSEIFTDGPAPVPRRMHSQKTKRIEDSQIFKPQEHIQKPMSYSREKFFQSSDIFLANKEQASFCNDTPVITDNTAMAVAGKKEKKFIVDSFFGNDPPQYYRKSINKNMTPADFQPKFIETTPQQKKERELFGGFHVVNKKKEEKNEKNEGNARERKRNNLRSVLDKKVTNENIPPQSDKPVFEYNPLKRKYEMLASSVFQEKTIKEFPNQTQREAYDEKRHKNHLYSDLLGTIYEDYSKKQPGSLISSSQH